MRKILLSGPPIIMASLSSTPVDHTKSLSFELWQQIITAACTDGGYTGRSLALTNKLFHAQSLSTRFHSLAFFSLARVEAFLAFLDNQPEECRPEIQHLYLSFVDEPEPAKPPADFWRTYSAWSPEQKHNHNENIKALTTYIYPASAVSHSK